MGAQHFMPLDSLEKGKKGKIGGCSASDFVLLEDIQKENLQTVKFGGGMGTGGNCFPCVPLPSTNAVFVIVVDCIVSSCLLLYNRGSFAPRNF